MQRNNEVGRHEKEREINREKGGQRSVKIERKARNKGANRGDKREGN